MDLDELTPSQLTTAFADAFTAHNLADMRAVLLRMNEKAPGLGEALIALIERESPRPSGD